MKSSISNIVKITTIFVCSCIILMAIIVLLFSIDLISNEIRLVYLSEHTKKYAHPSDSKLLQKISIVGNFAPASNQCGFIVAEARTTMLKPDGIRTFYAPIATDLSYDGEPPHKNVSLYIVNNQKDVKNLELFYPDIYERISKETMNNTHVYLLITAKTGYPPNYDLRCH